MMVKCMCFALTFLCCLFFLGVLLMRTKANGAEVGSGSSC